VTESKKKAQSCKSRKTRADASSRARRNGTTNRGRGERISKKGEIPSDSTKKKTSRPTSERAESRRPRKFRNTSGEERPPIKGPILSVDTGEQQKGKKTDKYDRPKIKRKETKVSAGRGWRDDPSPRFIEKKSRPLGRGT